MYLKIHEDGRIVAACDKELVGRVLEDEERYLDLDRYKGFYMGEVTGEEKVRDALKGFESANLVGSRCVGIALDMGLADKEDVMYIKETPYIQIYRI